MKQPTISKKSRTDFEALAKLEDSEIDFSDIPKQGPEFFKNAILILPIAKVPVSIRVDMNVLDWFKAKGPGYQTRMNAVLRMYAEQNGMKRWRPQQEAKRHEKAK
jgi:uncharacterized protein (DUF4415 family)